MSALDQVLPAAHFVEQHRRDVAGSPQQAHAATCAVSLAEMPLARMLFAIRGLAADNTALESRHGQPLLAQMLVRGFTVLADVPEDEIVIGSVGQPWKLRRGRNVPVSSASAFVDFDDPGFVKMAMSFGYERHDLRTRVITETRVLATDAPSRRAFSVYWLPVRVGSGLIRSAMLRAIRADGAGILQRSAVTPGRQQSGRRRCHRWRRGATAGAIGSEKPWWA